MFFFVDMFVPFCCCCALDKKKKKPGGSLGCWFAALCPGRRRRDRGVHRYRPGTAPTEAALPGSASAACSLGHLLGRLRTLLLQVLDHVPGLVDLRGKVLKVVRGDIKGFIAERRKTLGRQDLQPG